MKWLVGDNYTIFSFFCYQYPPLSIYLLFILCIKSCGFFVTEYVFLFNENLLLYNNDDFLIQYFELLL